jgi:hypothetical protein
MGRSGGIPALVAASKMRSAWKGLQRGGDTAEGEGPRIERKVVVRLIEKSYLHSWKFWKGHSQGPASETEHSS